MMKVAEIKVAPDLNIGYTIIKVYDNGRYVGDVVMKAETFEALTGRTPIIGDEYDTAITYIDY
jgi:hypothetical protein